MFFPKIVFREMTLEENINIIKWEYFVKDEPLNIHKIIVTQFKELDGLDENFSKEEIYKIIEQVVTKYYNKNKDTIKNEVLRYNEIWSKYNDLYFKELSKYLNVSWPISHKIIDAGVGLIPVFPRYLDSFGFSIGINIDEFGVKKISAHETLHFLWFEKWKELYPNCERKEFDSPYTPWLYSEMVTDPILNSEPLKQILKIEEKAYSSFYDIKDGNDYMMDNLKNIYNLNLSIEEKIKNGFEYISKLMASKKEEKITKK
jgi:hypothetical protein